LRQVLDLNYRTGRRKPGVRIELSKLKGAYRDQLAPFEGLWDFSQELDYYKGTIFRFPLRARTAQSKLMENGTPLDAEAVRICLDNFLEQEGRISLLFLRRIRFMDFRVHGDKKPRWSIQSEKDWFFSGWTKCTITKCMNQKLDGTFRERWRVAIQDLENLRTELPSRHKRTMKDVECGIAALIPEPRLKQNPIFTSAPVPKYFSTLPLSFPTDLPVHIHATFLLASDRASIPVEDSMQEDGAKWNRWLLSCAIPSLCLHFLEDLGRETHWVQDPFEFWPQDSPSKRHLSEAVYTSFWKMLPKSSRELFPVTRQIRAAKLGKRKPPELVKINEAIFDFLPQTKSLVLRDILESQIPTLVRPPEKVRRELQREMVVESITPKRLRELFKLENASQCLEKAASEHPLVLETLLEIVKPREEDFMELDGCRILPLADGSLGTLRLANPLKQVDHYFLANAEELKLFDFALGLLASQETGEAFKKAIMDFAKFNITKLDLAGIGILLGRYNFGNKTPTKEMDTWLGKFWDYCHRAESTWRAMKPFTFGLEICHYPIYVATCDGVRSYVEPEKLDMLPSVIDPDKPQQRSLCDKFPGIHVFGSDFLPSNLRTTESSFDTRASFTRLITAVSKLARMGGVDLEVYINNHLGLAEKKVCSVLGAQAWMLSNGSPD
jgi:sacsin